MRSISSALVKYVPPEDPRTPTTPVAALPNARAGHRMASAAIRVFIVPPWSFVAMIANFDGAFRLDVHELGADAGHPSANDNWIAAAAHFDESRGRDRRVLV